VTKADGHVWEFKARFRRNAYGWRSQPAIQRIMQAVSEIKKAARKDPVLAADGAVTLLERLSPALEHVDSSSGAIGIAVNNAIAQLVPIIARAPSDAETRQRWLERLWEAHGADQIPYIETLADYWGELCGLKGVASVWADRLVDITRGALSPDKELHGYFHGTTACLSALYRAERYAEIVDILQVEASWPYKIWAVRALAAMGKKSEAIRYAESSRGPWTPDGGVDAICEEILLSSGSIDAAYEKYGLRANRGGTYLATFRSVARKYPHRSAGQILADLVKTTPGDEGTWFAAAKEAGLYDEALALARCAPCDPKTLTRAARDFVEQQPAFAVGAGIAALHWLVQGYGYEITGANVLAAYSRTMKAAEKNGTVAETREEVKALVAGEPPGGIVSRMLGRNLGL
jgi:NAD(P)-dependent dehydrogenase (short-subunit alcohol dehydrogenase family)